MEISKLNDVSVTYDDQVNATFTVTGGRKPATVSMKKPDDVVLWSWSRSNGNSDCSGENEIDCTVIFDADSWDFDGIYTVEATNFASGNTQTTDSETFSVTVYRDVTVSITPSGRELVECFLLGF